MQRTSTAKKIVKFIVWIIFLISFLHTFAITIFSFLEQGIHVVSKKFCNEWYIYVPYIISSLLFLLTLVFGVLVDIVHFGPRIYAYIFGRCWRIGRFLERYHMMCFFRRKYWSIVVLFILFMFGIAILVLMIDGIIDFGLWFPFYVFVFTLVIIMLASYIGIWSSTIMGAFPRLLRVIMFQTCFWIVCPISIIFCLLSLVEALFDFFPLDYVFYTIASVLCLCDLMLLFPLYILLTREKKSKVDKTIRSIFLHFAWVVFFSSVVLFFCLGVGIILLVAGFQKLEFTFEYFLFGSSVTLSILGFITIIRGVNILKNRRNNGHRRDPLGDHVQFISDNQEISSGCFRIKSAKKVNINIMEDQKNEQELVSFQIKKIQSEKENERRPNSKLFEKLENEEFDEEEIIIEEKNKIEMDDKERPNNSKLIFSFVDEANRENEDIIEINE